MQQRRIGECSVAAIGLGCWSMSGMQGQPEVYGPVDKAESLATIRHALDIGVNFLDTAQVYGPFENEQMVGECIAGRRDDVYVATKFGFRYVDGMVVGIDSSPAVIRANCEDSLKRLGTERIDLYYQHRVDPNTSIEDVIYELEALRRDGMIRHIGLCELAPETLTRALQVGKIDAVQSEYSLWEREVETDILPLCQQHDIAFVAYSPLGRGFLAGNVKRAEELPKGDYRRHDPRYQGANFDANMSIVKTLEVVAQRHAATNAQIALAWLLAQGDGHVIPIPGTKRRARLDENTAAAIISLTQNDLDELNQAAPIGGTKGPRYNEANMAMVGL